MTVEKKESGAPEEQRHMLIEETITGFLDEMASDSPAPGGGSAAAMAAAMAAALAAMVCRLSYGKKMYLDVEAELKDIAGELDDTKGRLVELIDEDTDAFNEVMAAYKLPRGTDDEKKARRKAVQGATINAIRPPLEVCRLALNIIELAKIVAERGNVRSVTDAGTAAIMAKAAHDGARLNVLINLSSVKDEEMKKAILSELNEDLGPWALKTTRACLAIVEKKMSD